MSSVHIAITRQVRPGMEPAFEAALRKFARDSLEVPGMTGVHLIAPVPGTQGSEYGILRSFESQAASEAFYSSPLFQEWETLVAPLVIGGPTLRKLTGLEAFFRDAQSGPPPRWKMAVLTWLGVFPTALVWSRLLPNLFGGLHPILYAAILNVFVVISLAWGVMPLVSKLFSGWLRPAVHN